MRRAVARVKAVEQAFATLQQTLQRHPTDSEPSTVSGHDVYLTGSVSIAFAPNDATDAESLLTSAGTALARAQKEGRNKYQLFSQEMNAKARRHCAW